MSSLRFHDHPRRGAFRPRSLLVPLLLVSLVLLVGAAVLVAALAARASGGDSPMRAKRLITAQWKERSYAEVLASCTARLERSPLDPFYLTFGGFAAFYLGSAQASDEASIGYLRQSVALLRKALVLKRPRYPGEIRYILGKAYFLLGYYYLDASARFLEESKEFGYEAEDVDEYLAMAYYHLGMTDKAVAVFEEALRRSPTDALYVTAAMAMMRAGRNDKAAEYLTEAIDMTSDVAVEQQARFLLSEMRIAEKRFLDAEEQLSIVLSEDSESAEALYRLGLLYEAMGDQAKARSQWRKAIKADPGHQGARLKLN